MKKFLRSHISLVIQIVVTLVLVGLLITLNILKNNQSFCEQYTRTVARGYLNLFGRINALMTLSFTEMSVVCVAILLIAQIVFIIWNFKRKRTWAAIGKMFTIAIVSLGIAVTYIGSVELAYNRDALPIELYQGEIKKDELKKIATYFLKDFSKCANELEFDENGRLKDVYNHQELNKKLREEYKRLDNNYFSSYTPFAKQMLTSPIYTSLGLTGLFFGCLGEANLNYQVTPADRPFTYAHEMAHSKGVMRENDAQLVAIYILSTSKDVYFRYSAYINCFGSILDLGKLTGQENDYQDLCNLVDNKIWKNCDFINNYWDSRMILKKFGQAINDWYLKNSGQKEGTSSYHDTEPVVDPVTKDVVSLSRYQAYFAALYYKQIMLASSR